MYQVKLNSIPICGRFGALAKQKIQRKILEVLFVSKAGYIAEL